MNKSNKKNRRIALGAAVAGLIAGVAVLPGCPGGQDSSSKTPAERNGCNGPNGCGGAGHGEKKGEANGCGGANGCGAGGNDKEKGDANNCGGANGCNGQQAEKKN